MFCSGQMWLIDDDIVTSLVRVAVESVLKKGDLVIKKLTAAAVIWSLVPAVKLIGHVYESSPCFLLLFTVVYSVFCILH